MKPAHIARAVAALALVSAAAVHAQAYPARPMRLIVPFPPGGPVDIMGRAVAAHLWPGGTPPVIVDNRGGAGGNIGVDAAAKAPPDGYTTVISFVSTLAISAALYPKLPYDPARDLAPVAVVGSFPNVIVVHPTLPVKDVKELVALAKARPGQITYASSGNGSGGHLCMELFKTMTGTNFVHVPYKGGGPALVDVLAGQVQVLFTPPVSATQHVQSGRLRALAVSTVRRSAGMPDLPTIAESGVPGYDSGVWYGVLAPAGTPREIVMRVNGDVVKALQQPDFRTMLIANSIDPIGSSPEVLAQFIRIEMAKWAKVVRDADVRVD